MTTESNVGYPIRAVSKLTGIPVDTLRAWERRYGVVDPARDARGRLYSEGDVRKLRLLRLLVERGHAIGRLVVLTDDQLAALQTAPPGRGGELRAMPAKLEIEPLVLLLERFDAFGLERELRRLAAVLQPRQLVRDVALPLMRRVGEAWLAGEMGVAQEHLASAAVRNLLGALVRVHAPEEPRATLLFSTPPGEVHEFGILGAAMLAAAGGLGVLYLGPSLPAPELAVAARRSAARAVVLGVIGALGTSAAEAAVAGLAPELPRGVELWVGGPALPGVEAAVARVGGLYLHDFERYEEELRRLGGRF